MLSNMAVFAFYTLFIGLSAIEAAVQTGIKIDAESSVSLSDSAAVVAKNLLILYPEENRKGGAKMSMFQLDNWFWWLSGQCWTSLIEFTKYTNHKFAEDLASDAAEAQIGPAKDFLPDIFRGYEGNDDQGVFTLATMAALETGFRKPSKSDLKWLDVADNVFTEFTQRWQIAPMTCGGGLPWHNEAGGKGNDYKNSVSNGAFFNLAARLARYTGESKYAEWAEKIWQWQLTSGLINSVTYAVYDGISTKDCTSLDKGEWSYNTGFFLGGAAFMYNATNGSPKWKERADKMIKHAATSFFDSSNVIMEPQCESANRVRDYCNTDQRSFKGSLAQQMGYATAMYPDSRKIISPLLASSAAAVGAACKESNAAYPEMGQNVCPFLWRRKDLYDDSYRAAQVKNLVAQQYAALAVIQANLAAPRLIRTSKDPEGGCPPCPDASSK